MDHNTAPMDGHTLADAIHNRGINIRYLGKITGMIQKVKYLQNMFLSTLEKNLKICKGHLKGNNKF